MVQRYNSSTAVPTAQIAKPQVNSLSEIASGVREVALTAVDIVQKKVAERTASLEAAALNSARLELEKRGSQLAVDLQKGRVAGSDYVKDLERERAKLKQEVWAMVPSRIQSSSAAQMEWNNIWTGSEIASTRSAVAWQAEQEKSFAKRSLDDGLAAMAATVEIDPDSAARQLDGWAKGLPTYSGLLDAETLADAQSKGTQVILQGAVRGLSKQGRFEEADKLVTQAAGKLDPTQRKAFEAVIEDARNDIERERNKQETETAKAQQLNGNRFEADIIDGKANRTILEAKVKSGEISENDKPALMRSLRAEDDRRKAEAIAAKMSPEEKAWREDRSADQKLIFTAYAATYPSQFMGGYQNWDESMRARYDVMTADDQRALDKEMLDMRVNGRAASEVNTVYNVLLSEAKRAVPEWRLGSDADPKKLPKEALEFAGVLRGTAEVAAASNGGKPLTTDQARDYVTRALQSYQPDKWGSPLSAMLSKPWEDTSGQAADEAALRAALSAGLGRAPTEAEVARALVLAKEQVR